MALNVTGCQFWSECGFGSEFNLACLEGKSGQMIAGVSFIALRPEDGHQRQMQLFVQDPNRFMDEFSQASAQTASEAA